MGGGRIFNFNSSFREGLVSGTQPAGLLCTASYCKVVSPRLITTPSLAHCGHHIVHVPSCFILCLCPDFSGTGRVSRVSSCSMAGGPSGTHDTGPVSGGWFFPRGEAVGGRSSSLLSLLPYSCSCGRYCCCYEPAYKTPVTHVLHLFSLMRL